MGVSAGCFTIARMRSASITWMSRAGSATPVSFASADLPSSWNTRMKSSVPRGGDCFRSPPHQAKAVRGNPPLERHSGPEKGRSARILGVLAGYSATETFRNNVATRCCDDITEECKPRGVFNAWHPRTVRFPWSHI